MSESVEIPTSILENYISQPKALVIFAHGAGADKSSAFMEDITKLLNKSDINVLRFNFNYMDKRLAENKRYPPQRMPVLLTCFDKLLTNIETSLPIFLMGKSMGGRVASSLAEKTNSKLNGVICLGYPFHPQKQPEKLRLTPLQNTTQPTLIIQGDRDALGNQQEISTYRLSSLCTVYFLADGDHDLKPRVKSGYSHQQHKVTAVKEIVNFITLNS